MEQLQALAAILMAFPQWNDQPLHIDNTAPQPGNCGLFPLGIEELDRREDVTGQRTLRLRQRYTLRRVCPRGEDEAAWLLALQEWLSTKTVPRAFGTDGVLRAEKGRLVKPLHPGAQIYESTITVEYTKENEYGEN